LTASIGFSDSSYRLSSPVAPRSSGGRERSGATCGNQFGQEDTRPSPADGREVLSAASAPKKAQWYDGGHELNEQARTERENWLAQRLGVG
jgi:hypothetical protein